MRNFKKPILALILSGIIVAVLSAAMVFVYIEQSAKESDIKVREAYAGKIDTMFVGMSETRQAVIPAIIDEKIGTFSYSLSGGWQNLYASIMLLNEELERNDISVMVLELSSTVASITPDEDYREGSTLVVPRLLTWEERTEYIKNWTLQGSIIKNYIGFVQKEGMRMLGTYDVTTTLQDKGFCPYYSVNAEKTIDEASQIFETKQAGRLTKQNAGYIREIAKMCKERGITLICYTPIMAPSFILSRSGWDDLHEDFVDICREIGTSYVDFNLIKNRFELFDERTDFSEDDHLSESGAKVFTPLLAEVLDGVLQEIDVQFDSYVNYNDMMKDSPYGEWYD